LGFAPKELRAESLEQRARKNFKYGSRLCALSFFNLKNKKGK